MQKLEYNKNGSIVFMTFMFITIILVIVLSTLRTTSYFISLAREREEYEKQYYAAEALLNYGVSIVKQKKNENIVKKHKKEIVFNDILPFNFPDSYTGTLRYEEKGENNILYAELKSRDRVLISLSKIITY